MLKKTTESKLLAGYIYGDNVTKEYVYLPDSEVDTEEPMLVYEDNGGRDDIGMERALEIIEKEASNQPHILYSERIRWDNR